MPGAAWVTEFVAAGPAEREDRESPGIGPGYRQMCRSRRQETQEGSQEGSTGDLEWRKNRAGRTQEQGHGAIYPWIRSSFRWRVIVFLILARTILGGPPIVFLNDLLVWTLRGPWTVPS